MTSSVAIEVCVDSVASACAAQEGGADRIELCAGLADGGTTPSIGLIEEVRLRCRIGLHLLIRPRAGDFVYSPDEIRAMERDIAAAKIAGADGVVFGVLKPDGTVDRKRMNDLMERARPLSVTFHRAFDVVRDPFATLETLIELGIDRVLTSGQQATAVDGSARIADLVRASGERIAIMAGAGLTPLNVGSFVAETGVREVHVGAGVSRHFETTAGPLFTASHQIVRSESVREFRSALLR